MGPLPDSAFMVFFRVPFRILFHVFGVALPVVPIWYVPSLLSWSITTLVAIRVSTYAAKALTRRCGRSSKTSKVLEEMLFVAFYAMIIGLCGPCEMYLLTELGYWSWGSSSGVHTPAGVCVGHTFVVCHTYGGTHGCDV